MISVPIAWMGALTNCSGSGCERYRLEAHFWPSRSHAAIYLAVASPPGLVLTVLACAISFVRGDEASARSAFPPSRQHTLL